MLEDAFLAFINTHNLPRPETNVWLKAGPKRYEVDCLWRAQRLIVELDGRAAHDTARAFERDREKDRRLRVARWNSIRVTWLQLQHEAAELAADVGALLS